jgi:hypothetical protein
MQRGGVDAGLRFFRDTWSKPSGKRRDLLLDDRPYHCNIHTMVLMDEAISHRAYLSPGDVAMPGGEL